MALLNVWLSLPVVAERDVASLAAVDVVLLLPVVSLVAKLPASLRLRPPLMCSSESCRSEEAVLDSLDRRPALPVLECVRCRCR